MKYRTDFMPDTSLVGNSMRFTIRGRSKIFDMSGEVVYADDTFVKIVDERLYYRGRRKSLLIPRRKIIQASDV